MWKWLLGIFLVCVLMCGVGGFFALRSQGVKERLNKFRGVDQNTPVRLEPAAKGDLVKKVSAPGQIEPKTKVQITAQVSARITALPFKEGDEVKKGDVVVRLDAEDLIAALEAQRASLKADEARLQGTQAAARQAKADLDRVRDLFEKNVRSKADLEAAQAGYDQAQSSLRVGEASIEITRANIRRAERDVQNCVITSPIDGTLIKVNNEVGELVLGTFNNAGQVIMEIADLSVMLMKAEVDESSISQVKKGQRSVIFINAYAGKSFTGVVDQITQQRQVSREGKNYFPTEILVELDKDQRLLAGLTANTDIQVETQYGVLRVPSQSVVDRRIEELPTEAQGKLDPTQKSKAFTRVVYKMVDGKAVAMPVLTGTSDLTHTVVLSGLNDGEKVVTGPFKVLATLKDGLRISDMSAAHTTAAGTEGAGVAAGEQKAGEKKDGDKGAGEEKPKDQTKPETAASGSASSGTSTGAK